jgi:hypothetical protein
MLPEVTYLPHPGYHRRGCQTPADRHLIEHLKAGRHDYMQSGLLPFDLRERTIEVLLVLADVDQGAGCVVRALLAHLEKLKMQLA